MTPFAYAALLFIIAFVLGLLGSSGAVGKASYVFMVIGAISLVMALVIWLLGLRPRRTR